MILALALALSAQQPATPQSLSEALGFGQLGLRGAALDAAVARAASAPLGSEANPVRASGVRGERDYLSRLRCADGKAPELLGRNSGMPGPFGGITDIYALRCNGAAPSDHKIIFDMYHQHRETRPAPGFTLAP